MEKAPSLHDHDWMDHLRVRRWLLIALLVSILAHVVFFLCSRYIYFNPEEIRQEKPDLRQYLTTRINVDPQFFKADVVDVGQTSATMEPPTVTVDNAAIAREEKRTIQRLVENFRPEGASPPLLTDRPVASAQPQVELPQGNSALRQLPPSQAFSDVDLVHQNSLGSLPTATQASPNPNADVNQPGVSGNGTSEQGVPGFQRLAQLLNKKPEEVPKAIKSGQVLRIGDKVLFEFDSWVLKSAAEPILQEVLLLMQKEFPQAVIQIDGYTDSYGDAAYNQKLSEERAVAVRDWLVTNGFPPDRIRTQGKGASNFLVSPRGSIEEQAPNRRTEIRVQNK